MEYDYWELMEMKPPAEMIFTMTNSSSMFYFNKYVNKVKKSHIYLTYVYMKCMLCLFKQNLDSENFQNITN